MSQLHIKDGDHWRPLTPADLASGGGGTSGGLTNAELRAAPLAVSGGLTDTQLRAAAVPVDSLASIGAAKQLPAGSISASVALTPTCRRVSIYARLADIRYAVGAGNQTASATTHFISMGERLDFDVPASAHIGVIRTGAVDGVLEVTELA